MGRADKRGYMAASVDKNGWEGVSWELWVNTNSYVPIIYRWFKEVSINSQRYLACVQSVLEQANAKSSKRHVTVTYFVSMLYFCVDRSAWLTLYSCWDVYVHGKITTLHDSECDERETAVRHQLSWRSSDRLQMSLLHCLLLQRTVCCLLQ